LFRKRHFLASLSFSLPYLYRPFYQTVCHRSPDKNKQAPFSLAPSIFLPFKDFAPGDAPILDQTQKLQKILQKLPEQQAAVRGNMVCMVEQRVKNLKARAKEELDEIEGDYEDDSGDPEERKRVRAEVDAMFERTKKPVKEGAKSEDFEVKPGDFKFYRGNGGTNPNRDVAMGGVEAYSKPRTARMVWEGLSRDLLEVVDRAASEMDAYNRHAQNTLAVYEQALERRGVRHAAPPTATGVSGGILRNRHEESPIDMHAIRRMSTGMPLVGVAPAPPTRSYEKFDDIARRGSR
jgi:hypothetical protein